MGPISEKTHNLKIFWPNSLRYNVKSLQKSLFFYFWTWYYKIHISFWFILPVKNLLFSSSALKIDPKKIWLINFDDIWSILTIFGHYWPFSQERFPRGLAHCALWCKIGETHCPNTIPFGQKPMFWTMPTESWEKSWLTSGVMNWQEK